MFTELAPRHLWLSSKNFWKGVTPNGNARKLFMGRCWIFLANSFYGMSTKNFACTSDSASFLHGATFTLRQNTANSCANLAVIANSDVAHSVCSTCYYFKHFVEITFYYMTDAVVLKFIESVYVCSSATIIHNSLLASFVMSAQVHDYSNVLCFSSKMNITMHKEIKKSIQTMWALSHRQPH